MTLGLNMFSGMNWADALKKTTPTTTKTAPRTGSGYASPLSGSLGSKLMTYYGGNKTPKVGTLSSLATPSFDFSQFRNLDLSKGLLGTAVNIAKTGARSRLGSGSRTPTKKDYTKLPVDTRKTPTTTTVAETKAVADKTNKLKGTAKTGKQVKRGVRTFRGTGAADLATRGKMADALRIGQGKRRSKKRAVLSKQQRNTLGLGSGVGLQY